MALNVRVRTVWQSTRTLPATVCGQGKTTVIVHAVSSAGNTHWNTDHRARARKRVSEGGLSTSFAGCSTEIGVCMRSIYRLGAVPSSAARLPLWLSDRGLSSLWRPTRDVFPRRPQ